VPGLVPAAGVTGAAVGRGARPRAQRRLCDRALNGAFATAVSACACEELGPARSALAARAPPEAADAAQMDVLTAAFVSLRGRL